MNAIKKLLKGHRTLVFLDLEGTQFSHEIIAIGAVKVKVDEQGKIEKGAPKTFKCYVKCMGTIGKFITNLTKIDETILKEQGLTLQEAFKALKTFIKEPLEECSYIVFGSNDAKMIIDSISYSKPENEHVGYEIVKNSIDYLSFISQFIKDDKGNNYSLVNYLNVFNVKPYGESHDPLNDAMDLMNLYKAMDEEKDILLKEYLKVLQKAKFIPAPVKKVIVELSENRDMKSEDFIKECKDYLL